MTWTELQAALEARTLVEGPDFEVLNIAAADLLSDILATQKEEFVILTGQVSPQAIRTAITVGALGVVIVRGKQPPPEVIGIAQNYGVPLAVSDLRMFEACVAAGALLWNSPSSKNSSTA